MDISKLKRQFVREARSSPKKAAVLVLVLAIAAWRIIPLAASMLSAGQNQPSQIAGQTPAASIPARNRKSTTLSSAARPSWHELAGRISSDPLMQSADLTTWRNPFGDLPAPALANVEAENAEETAPVLSTSGLVLSSTAVGMRRRTALINGRIYAEGDLLDLPGAAIMVVSIRSGSVLLESDGEQIDLSIAERPASQKIQVRREQSSAHSGNASKG
jgi:hypothetical protein